MSVLTDEEIKEITAMMATDTAINFARAVESAVLENLDSSFTAFAFS